MITHKYASICSGGGFNNRRGGPMGRDGGQMSRGGGRNYNGSIIFYTNIRIN